MENRTNKQGSKQVVNYLGMEMNSPEDFKRWQFNYKFYQELYVKSRMKDFNLPSLETTK